LNNPAVASEFVLEVCDSNAHLPDGEQLASFRLWLLGPRADVTTAFPLIIAKLNEEVIRDYVAIAEPDYNQAMREKEEKKKNDRETRVFIIRILAVWIGAAVALALLCSFFGWIASVVAFISWLMSPLFVVLGYFLAYAKAEKGRRAKKK